MAQQITHQFNISAPMERVWAVVSNFSSYADWNPFITQAQGALEKGAPLELMYEFDCDVPMGTTISHLTPPHTLAWCYRSSFGALTIQHSIQIQPDGEGKCTMQQAFHVLGWMSKSYVKRARPIIESGLAAMAECAAIAADAEHVPMDDELDGQIHASA